MTGVPSKILNDLFAQKLDVCEGKEKIFSPDYDKYKDMPDDVLLEVFREKVGEALKTLRGYEEAECEREAESKEWDRKNTIWYFQFLIKFVKYLDGKIPNSGPGQPYWIWKLLDRLDEHVRYWSGWYEEDQREHWSNGWEEDLDAADRIFSVSDCVEDLIDEGKTEEVTHEVCIFLGARSKCGGAYVRDRLLEVAFARKIVPPRMPDGTPVQPTTLQWIWNGFRKRLGFKPKKLPPSNPEDTLVKILDVDPQSKSMAISFRGQPTTSFIRAPRADVSFKKDE